MLENPIKLNTNGNKTENTNMIVFDIPSFEQLVAEMYTIDKRVVKHPKIITKCKRKFITPPLNSRSGISE